MDNTTTRGADAGSDERKIWSLLKSRSENEAGRTIRIAEHAGKQLGIHKHRATDIINSWHNRGLVITFQSGTRAALTSTGTQVDDPTAL